MISISIDPYPFHEVKRVWIDSKQNRVWIDRDVIANDSLAVHTVHYHYDERLHKNFYAFFFWSL